MKTKILSVMLAVAALSAASCSKPAQEPTLPAEAAYVGDLSVIEIAGALYEQKDVHVSYELADDGTLSIRMKDVSFSAQMPVKLSLMVLSDVPYVRHGSTLTLSLSGTDIIPQMEMRGELVPYERYLCTDLTGTINPEKMVLSMKLGGFQTDYSGDYRE